VWSGLDEGGLTGPRRREETQAYQDCMHGLVMT